MKNPLVLLVVLMCVIIALPVGINSCGGAMRMIVVKTDPPDEPEDPVLPDFKISPVLVLLRDTSNKPIGFEINWGKLESDKIKGYQFRRDTSKIPDDLVSTAGKIIKVAQTQGGAVSQLFPQPSDSSITKLKSYDLFDVQVGTTYYYRITYIDSTDKESKQSPEASYSIGTALITGSDTSLAGAGDTVTLTGSDFGDLFNQNTCKVIFKGVKPIWHQGLVPAEFEGEIVSWTDEKVVVKVPFGAITGTVRLMVQNYSTDTTFELQISDPYITSIANDGGFPYPDMGTEGTSMILKGKNFGSPGSTVIEVRLNGNLLPNDQNLVTLISSEQLNIKLPSWNDTQKPDVYDQFMSIKFNGKNANEPLLDYNIKPIIKFKTSASSGPHPFFVNFDGSESKDPDSSDFSLKWDFGDDVSRGISYGKIVDHSFKFIGLYKVNITASDVEGATSTASTDITVTTATSQGAWSQYAHDVSNTNSTIAIGPATGALKWVYQVKDAIYSSPILADDGTVYFGCTDGNLYSLDKTGALKWQYSTGSKIGYSTPAVSVSGDVYIGSTDGNLYSIRDDGTLEWKFNTGGDLWANSPAVDSLDNVYIASRSNNIYMLNNKGEQIMIYTGLSDDVDGKVGVTSDGKVVFGSVNKTIGQLSKTFSLDWSKPLADVNFMSAPSLTSNGRFIIGTNSGNVQCFSDAGIELWNFAGNGKISGTIAQGNPSGMTYIGDYAGNLNAIKSNGMIAWMYKTGYPIISSPIIDGSSNVYFGNQAGEFFAIDPEGNLIWKFNANGKIHGSPAMGSDGCIYFTTDAGFVYCLGPGPAQSGLMPPTNVKATDGTLVEQVDVTWDAPATGPVPDKYYIYRADAANGAFVKVGEAAGTSYSDKVTKSHTYWYKLKSVKNDFNFSAFSATDSGYPAKLEKPENVNASQGTYIDKVEVTWSPPSKGPLPTSYNVYRSDKIDGTYEKIDNITGLVYVDKPTPFDFWYKLRGIKEGYEDGPFSDPAKGYIAKLQPPTDVNATDQLFVGSIEITWKAPATGPVPDAYDLYRSAYVADQPPNFFLVAAGLKSLDFIDKPNDGKVYTYALKSTKTYYDASAYSNSDNGQNKLLSPPENVVATDGLHSDKVVITWDAPTDGPTPDRYAIYRADSQFGVYEFVDVVFGKTSFDDLTVTDLNKYWYSVVSQLKNYPDSGYSLPDQGWKLGFIITPFEDEGQCTDVATGILKDGIPAVAYFDMVSGQLKFWCANNHYPKSIDDWTMTIIDEEIKGRYPTIFLNSNLKPIVAYYDSDNQDLKFAASSVEYPEADEDWSWHQVYTDADSGQNPTMMLTADMRPIIVCQYKQDKTSDLQIAESYVTDPTNIEDWSVYRFSTNNVIEGNPTLGMLHDGSMLFAYTDSTTALKVRYSPIPQMGGMMGVFDAGDWTVATVHSGGVYGPSPSIAVNGKGMPVIAYGNSPTSNIKIAEGTKPKPADTSEWNFFDVSPVDSITENPCLVILPDLTYAVSFSMFATTGVGYYQSNSPDLATTSWTRYDVDTGVSNMYFNSMKHLVNGQPFIGYIQAKLDSIPKLAYIDKPDLKYAPMPPTGVQASDGTFFDAIEVTWVYPTIGIRPTEYRMYKSIEELSGYSLFDTYPSYLYNAMDWLGEPADAKDKYRFKRPASQSLFWYKLDSLSGFTPDYAVSVSDPDSGYISEITPQNK